MSAERSGGGITWNDFLHPKSQQYRIHTSNYIILSKATASYNLYCLAPSLNYANTFLNLLQNTLGSKDAAEDNQKIDTHVDFVTFLHRSMELGALDNQSYPETKTFDIIVSGNDSSKLLLDMVKQSRRARDKKHIFMLLDWNDANDWDSHLVGMLSSFGDTDKDNLEKSSSATVDNASMSITINCLNVG